MQQKNIFLLLALSGSVLMVMLVSTLLFIPHTASLQANMTLDAAPDFDTQAPTQKMYQGREPDEIMQTIQKYVENNDPDTAKRLYEELYSSRRYNEMRQMG